MPVIIAFSVILLIAMFVVITSYICFRRVFYFKNPGPVKDGEFDYPVGKVYEPYREEMKDWQIRLGEIPYRSFEIRSFDGLKLCARYYECMPGAPIELMFHGYQGNSIRDLSGGVFRAFKLCHNVLLIDHRAAGASEGSIITFGINEHRDCLMWIDVAKKTFGEDTYICCHNTFHNNLDLDEVWHTACNWWDIPRDIGHTDENISYPVRMGVMLANKFPMEIDMYYSKKEQDYFDHMAQGAPFNCREFHHTYMSDGFWGNNFTDPTFLRKIRSCDRKIGMLNDWQTEYPKLDVLVVFGSSAQNNWYPNYENRNVWDIDGSLKIMKKCDQMWNAGYRCALVPDYAIEDGRITLEGDKIAFNGYLFDHCVFMYPKYAKAETYEFLNKAGAAGASVVAVGQANVDFNGNPAELTIPCYEEFNLDILQTMGCPVRIIPDGCVYTDGSFCIVHADGLVEGTPKYFEFELDGVRYNGDCTGVLAYRKDGRVIGTEGTTLFVDGKCIAVENPVKD